MIKKNILLILTALTLSSACHASDEMTAATDALRKYCLSELCLGMSLTDVKNIKKGKLSNLWSNPPWGRSCNDVWRTEYGTYTAEDGYQYMIGFWDMPGDTPDNDRWRIRSISLTAELNLVEEVIIQERLIRRYKMTKKSDPRDEKTDVWISEEKNANAVLNQPFHIGKSTKFILDSIIANRVEMIQGQSICGGDRKKQMPNI